MTPQDKIYWLVFNKLHKFLNIPSTNYPCPGIEKLVEQYRHTPEFQEAVEEVRQSGIQTDLQSPFSRHYETQEVAHKLPDGSWVGWTYYYGGGKHSSPEEVPWMEYSYNVQCDEHREVKTVLYFKRKD